MVEKLIEFNKGFCFIDGFSLRARCLCEMLSRAGCLVVTSFSGSFVPSDDGLATVCVTIPATRWCWQEH